MKTYTATASKDISKKRKSWLDCKVTINHANRLVTVVSDDHNPLYKGTLTNMELNSLVAREETKCGSLLVLLEEPVGCLSSSPSSASSSSPGPHLLPSTPQDTQVERQVRMQHMISSTTNMPPPAAISTLQRQNTSSLLKAFKPPSRIGTAPSMRQQHRQSSVALKLGPTSARVSTQNIRAHVSNVNSPNTATTTATTSILVSSKTSNDTPASAPLPSPASVPPPPSSSSSSSSSSSLLSKTPLQASYMCQPLKRNIAISTAFNDSNRYAKEMLHACREEVFLLINQTMKHAEDKLLKNRGGAGSGVTSFPSMNRAQHFNPQLHTATMKRAATLPLALIQEVELIKPSGSKVNYNTQNKHKQSKGQYSYKKSRYGYEYDGDDDRYRDEDDDAYTTKTAPSNLYIKVHGHRTIDKRLSSFSKNDVWLLWAPDSAVSERPLDIFDGIPPLPHQQQNKNISRDDSAPFRYARAAFMEQRRTRGYCWPWFNGYLFQEVWAVRSMWYGFSGDGLLEVSSLDGSISIHPNMTKYMNTKSGSYRLAGLRSFNDSQLLMAIDLLRGGAGINAPLSQTIAGLTFSSLQATPIFKNLLDLSSSTESTSRSIQQATSKGGKNDFPTVADDVISRVLEELCMEFGLNVEQRRIVEQTAGWFSATAARSNDSGVILVDGVFGSGKSHLMSSLVVLMTRLSAKAQGMKIKCQISSNTNVAVDRVLTHLIRDDQHKKENQSLMTSSSSSQSTWPKVARVGALEKIDKTLLYSNCFVHSSENKKSILSEFERALKRDSDPRLKALMKVTSGEANFIEKQKSRLQDADVVGVTCASANSALLTGIQSHVLILDEVSQMTEALSLLPIAAARPMKILLIGDPKQLPPVTATMQSNEEQDGTDNCPRNDFSRTMYDRLAQMSKSSSLRIQYRCHPKIAEICSHLFYDGTLKHGIDELDRLPLFPSLSTITAVNNVGEDTKRGESSINKSECRLICQMLMVLKSCLSDSGAPERTIGVICMYKAQAYEINEAMASACGNMRQSNIIISTVDAFQGNEMDIIIICTTRNTASEFLSNPNRINVAISRARSHLILVGNIKVLKENALWGKVFSFPHNLVDGFPQFENMLNGDGSNSSNSVIDGDIKCNISYGDNVVDKGDVNQSFDDSMLNFDIDDEEVMIEEAIAIQREVERQQLMMCGVQQQQQQQQRQHTDQNTSEQSHKRVLADEIGNDDKVEAKGDKVKMTMEKEKENLHSSLVPSPPNSPTRIGIAPKKKSMEVQKKKRPKNTVMHYSSDEDDYFKFSEEEDEMRRMRHEFTITTHSQSLTQRNKAEEDKRKTSHSSKSAKKPKRSVD